MAGRRKQRKIVIREDRLSKLDGTKMEVAIWLLAKGKVEDRTHRSQPSPPRVEETEVSAPDETATGQPADAGESA